MAERTIEVTLQINGRDYSGRIFQGASENIKHLGEQMGKASEHGGRLGHAFEHMGHHLAHIAEKGGELLALLTGLSAVGSFAGIAESVKAAGENMAKLYNQSELLNVSVQKLRELRNAGKLLEIDPEKLDRTLQRVGAIYGAIRGGDEKLFTKVAMLDPTLAQHLQNAKNVAEAHDLIVDRLRELPAAERLAMNKALMGGKDITLAREATLSREEYDKITDEYRKLTGDITQEQARAADELERAQKKLGTAFTGIAEQVAVSVSPAIQQMVESITRFIAEHRQLIATHIADWAGHVVAYLRTVDWPKLGADLYTVGKAISALAAGAVSLLEGFRALTHAFGDFERWLRHIIPGAEDKRSGWPPFTTGPTTEQQRVAPPPPGGRLLPDMTDEEIRKRVENAPSDDRSLPPRSGVKIEAAPGNVRADQPPPGAIILPFSTFRDRLMAARPRESEHIRDLRPQAAAEPETQVAAADTPPPAPPPAPLPALPPATQAQIDAIARHIPNAAERAAMERYRNRRREPESPPQLPLMFNAMAAVLSRLSDAIMLLVDTMGGGGAGAGAGAGGLSEGGGYGGGGGTEPAVSGQIRARGAYTPGRGAEDRADRAARVYNPGHGAEDRADRATLDPMVGQERGAKPFAGSSAHRGRAMAHFAGMAGDVMQRLQHDFPGHSREDYAAALGSLGHESMGFTAFQEKNPRSGRGGAGWAQWTGPRRRTFEKWAAARGLDPKDDATSYAFMTSPSGEGREFGKALDAAARRQGLSGKVVAFEESYERAGVKAFGSRTRYAEAALTAKPVAPPTMDVAAAAKAPTTPPPIQVAAAAKAQPAPREIVTTPKAPAQPRETVTVKAPPQPIVTVKAPAQPREIVTPKAPAQPREIVTREIVTPKAPPQPREIVTAKAQPAPREISAVGFADARGGTGPAQAHRMELGRGQVDVRIKLDQAGQATTSVQQHAGGAFALNTGADMTGRRTFVPGSAMHTEPIREPWQSHRHSPDHNAPTEPIRKGAR